MKEGPVATLAILFRGVMKRYGKRPVLRGLDLELGLGESLALVGVNGAGKTTCLKALLDFSAIDAGEIRIFGCPHIETQARARLAFLPERFLPPYYLTGAEFLRYTAKLHRLEYRHDLAARMCAELDLDVDALHRATREYSKGMSQKLGLIATFLSGKELYVLDEPMSGLDPRARALVKRRLHEHRTAGGAVLFSTHTLSDAEELCDRLAILHAGELRFLGTPRECRDQFQAENLEQAYLRCIEQQDLA